MSRCVLFRLLSLLQPEFLSIFILLLLVRFVEGLLLLETLVLELLLSSALVFGGLPLLLFLQLALAFGLRVLVLFAREGRLLGGFFDAALLLLFAATLFFLGLLLQLLRLECR